MASRAELYTLTVHLRRYLEYQRAIGCAGVVSASAVEREALDVLTRKLEAKTLAAVKAQLGDSMPRPRTQEPEPAARRPPAAQPQAQGIPQPVASTKIPDVKTDGPSLWKQLGSRPVQIFQRASAAAPVDMAPPLGEPLQQPQKTPSVVVQAPAQAGRELRRPEDRTRAPQAPPRAGQANVPNQINLLGADEEEATLDQGAALMGFDDTPERIKKLEAMTRGEKLEFLRKCLGDCERCGLASGRNKIVFGDGWADAELVFVGEAPGFYEDKQGVPFVGKAGELLDRMIVAMGLKRDKVYICNVIKCRPPDNRDPAPEEIQACSPFLYKQLEAIDPKVIVTLGRFAANCLMGTQKTMGSMRGRWHDWRGIPVMPTFHPAYLLRNEQDKRLAWEDLQKVMKMMGLKRR
jgi:DNA polymerase